MIQQPPQKEIAAEAHLQKTANDTPELPKAVRYQKCRNDHCWAHDNLPREVWIRR